MSLKELHIPTVGDLIATRALQREQLRMQSLISLRETPSDETRKPFVSFRCVSGRRLNSGFAAGVHSRTEHFLLNDEL